MALTSSVQLDDLIIGYPKLSGRMELYPENAIFRRFGALNSQDLLYQQAELIELEFKLRRQQKADHDNGGGLSSRYGLNWPFLSLSADPLVGDGKQLELVRKIHEKLQTYNQSLVHQAIILGLPEPGKYDLDCLQNYLATREMGPYKLSGRDSDVWGSMDNRKLHCPDLVALRARPQEDAFSRWVADKAVVKLLGWGLDRFIKPSARYGTQAIRDNTLLRVTYGFTTVMASLLPILSITILYNIKSMSARLGVIVVFTFIVSLCLATFASARRTDIFAVVAAFSAIQVVFIGINDKNGNS